MVTNAAPQPSPTEPLSDEELLAGGLAPQEVWVRNIPRNTQRKQRNERYRENKAASGLKQISITVPMNLVDRFKALAKDACETGSLPEQPELIDGLFPHAATPCPASGAPAFAPPQVEHRALMEQAAQLEARLKHEEGVKRGILQAHADDMERFRKRYDSLLEYVSSLKAQLRQANHGAAQTNDVQSPWGKFLWFGLGIGTGAMLAMTSILAFGVS